MATSTQSALFQGLTYNDDITNEIISSGGTIVFTRDNVIMASEISEAEYRSLLNNPHISKLEVLPLKRYGNQGVTTTSITTIL